MIFGWFHAVGKFLHNLEEVRLGDLAGYLLDISYSVSSDVSVLVGQLLGESFADLSLRVFVDTTLVECFSEVDRARFTDVWIKVLALGDVFV